MILSIEAGSISICIFFDFKANFAGSLVIRSSNLAPTAKIKSLLCIAMFASYVPCIPNIPKNLSSLAG